MGDFEKMTVLLFAGILMINIGLIAINTSDSGIKFQVYARKFNYSDLNSAFFDLRPPAETGKKCVGWLECGVQAVSELVGTFIYGLSSMLQFSIFFFTYLPEMIFGYAFVLNYIAGVIEPGFGAVHILFTAISGVIMILVIMGMFTILKSLSAIIRGK